MCGALSMAVRWAVHELRPRLAGALLVSGWYKDT
jgi:hypothetical protein